LFHHPFRPSADGAALIHLLPRFPPLIWPLLSTCGRRYFKTSKIDLPCSQTRKVTRRDEFRCLGLLPLRCSFIGEQAVAQASLDRDSRMCPNHASDYFPKRPPRLISPTLSRGGKVYGLLIAYRVVSILCPFLSRQTCIMYVGVFHHVAIVLELSFSGVLVAHTRCCVR